VKKIVLYVGVVWTLYAQNSTYLFLSQTYVPTDLQGVGISTEKVIPNATTISSLTLSQNLWDNYFINFVVDYDEQTKKSLDYMVNLGFDDMFITYVRGTISGMTEFDRGLQTRGLIAGFEDITRLKEIDTVNFPYQGSYQRVLVTFEKEQGMFDYTGIEISQLQMPMWIGYATNSAPESSASVRTVSDDEFYYFDPTVNLFYLGFAGWVDSEMSDFRNDRFVQEWAPYYNVNVSFGLSVISTSKNFIEVRTGNQDMNAQSALGIGIVEDGSAGVRYGFDVLGVQSTFKAGVHATMFAPGMVNTSAFDENPMGYAWMMMVGLEGGIVASW
jgi:hypothetical protein